MKKYVVDLSAEERQRLEQIVRVGKAAASFSWLLLTHGAEALGP